MEQPPHPPPVLPEEIVEEILLRFPPEDPASLVHAALVCKPWYGIISGDGFCRRFREFHRAAQMLGFFCNVLDARFIPTSSFRPPHAGRFYAFEARHGRVLLDPGYDGEEHFIVVWDPITDERWEVPVPFPEAFRELELENWNATVLCAATASGSCNHHDCHGGPFMVVYLGPMLEPELMSFHVYPSEADSWSQQTSVPNYHWVDEEVLTALVGSTLYFSMDHSTRALSYDLATLETSVIHLPPKPVECDTATALMAMKNGGLGVARLDEAAKLSLWSMEVNVNSNGDMGWTQIKVIELDKVLPVNACSICSGFLSFAQGVGVFFIGTYDGLFTFDLMSGRARKVFEEPCDEIGILGVVPCVVPFVSFYTPGDRTAPTIAALEAYRFDKVRPVRDSMIDAVRVWKKLTGEDANEGRNKDLADGEGKLDSRRSMQRGGKPESFDDSSPDSPSSNVKGSSIAEKAAVLLKKRPTLTDRELNPEFFQKLETRKTDDLAVEVVVRRKTLQSHLRSEDETEEDDDPVGPADSNGSAEDEANLTQMCASSNFQNIQDKWAGQRGNRNKDTKARTADVEDRVEPCTKDSTAATMNIPGEGPFINNKTNWLAIQRQLSHLERQQTSLMNMLQDFMGGAHDSMVTLENRVHGLERVVEEMAREISLSSGRRGGGPALGFDSSLGRSSKYNGVHEYSNSKFGRSSDGRMGFAERYFSADSMASGTKNPSWRPDSEPCMNVRRGLDSVSSDNRMTRNERSNDQAGPRRGWDKGQGPFRFCEGPSARSAWRASKDEATLEAIRVAGEDHGNSMAAARVAIPGLDGEALNDDNQGDERGPLWEAWTRAMDAVHLEDMDSAYAEVLSTGDAELLVKLMEQTGPVVDQLSNEVANEVLHAVGQFLVEECFYDVALNWLQQVKSMHYYVCPDMVDWEAWTRAMDAVHLEDIDSAYAEVLSTGDAELLVKLMQQTGPVVDQLSNEVANEVLHAVGQFLVEECFYDVALNWLQQLTDLVMENGSDYLGIPLDAKQDLLLVLHEATAIELPDDWEGATPMQIMKQLASSWRIDLQNLSIRVTYIDCRHMG